MTRGNGASGGGSKLAAMAAYIWAEGGVFVVGDGASVVHKANSDVAEIRKQNDEVVGLVKLSEHCFVVVGKEPTFKRVETAQ